MPESWKSAAVVACVAANGACICREVKMQTARQAAMESLKKCVDGPSTQTGLLSWLFWTDNADLERDCSNGRHNWIR